MSGGAGWSVTKKDFENVEYTYKWHIENFDFAMETENGKIESSSFCIPGVPGEFKMMVLKKVCKFGSGRSYSHKMPEKIILRGEEGHLTVEIKHLFSVFLKTTERDTRAAAKVEVTQEGKDTLYGKFGDSSAHKFLNPLRATGFGLLLQFDPEIGFKYRDDGTSKDGKATASTQPEAPSC